MLALQALAFDYGDKPLLRDISLELASGEVWHIQGPNGRGKTTLLKIMAGLLKPESGSILWQGEPIEGQLAYYQSHLWYWGNRLGLSRYLRLEEECAAQQKLFGWKDEALKLYLSALELHTKLDTPIASLSLGQQRKAGLLMMILAGKPLWIMDEPLLGLDSRSLEFFWQVLSEHQQAGGMAILSSHQTLSTEACLTIQEYAL